jgi:hypothetical protein
MTAKLELNTLMAMASLSQLNAEAVTIPDEPVLVEVCKALTLAILHEGIEARVVCRNSMEAADACTMLIRRMADKDFAGAKWDHEKLELVLSNGSAVAVKLKGQP